MPFADGVFDCVVSTLALHHWQDPVAVLKELQRVAQPAGRIIVFDTRRDIHSWLWTALKVGQTFGEHLQLCENDEPSASISASYTASELQRLALQAGWERAQIRTKLGWLMLERLPAQSAAFPVPPTLRRQRNGMR
ncbi:MAG: methyltransferase domain-containing protein [Chloroflexota bacterium]|nr:methyltransferase domain-containing protein [Chloroflexota bacterium]